MKNLLSLLHVTSEQFLHWNQLLHFQACPLSRRFHKIGTKSATFKTKIENVEGALELLIEVGFRPVVIEFEQYYKINNVEEHIAFLKEVLVIIQERVLYCQERENISKARAINANKEEGEYVKLVHSLVVDDQKNREDKWGKK